MDSHDAHPGTASTPRRTAVRLLRFGDCEIDLASRELTRQGEPVPIRRQVFDLLVLLLQRRPQAVTHDELRRQVWDRDAVATSAIARAVLEARRAIGDGGRRPRLIVNVHGVGYRFDGRLPDGGAAVPTAAPHLAGQARLHLLEAEDAYWTRQDAALARLHADKALGEASRRSLAAETGEALCWLGWLGMTCATLEEAAGHAGQALRFALEEGDPTRLARARSVKAATDIARADVDAAALLLTQAWPVLAKDGHAGHRHRCESLLGVAARHLGLLDLARHWSLESLHTAREAGLDGLRLRALGDLAIHELATGDGEHRDGRPKAARAAWTRAIEASDAVIDQTDPLVEPGLQAACRETRALVLARFGRLDAARESLGTVETLLAGAEHPSSPEMLERRIGLRLAWLRLSLLESDLIQAQQQVDRLLRDLQAGACGGPWVPTLYELAATVAESHGRPDLALHWARAHHAAWVAQSGRQAHGRLRVGQRQAAIDASRQELDSLRRRAALLQQFGARQPQWLPAADAPGRPPADPLRPAA